MNAKNAPNKTRETVTATTWDDGARNVCTETASFGPEKIYNI